MIADFINVRTIHQRHCPSAVVVLPFGAFCLPITDRERAYNWSCFFSIVVHLSLCVYNFTLKRETDISAVARNVYSVIESECK